MGSKIGPTISDSMATGSKFAISSVLPLMNSRISFLGFLFLAAASQTHANDLGLGGSRSAGMGGAGLAIVRDSRGPGASNPANFALHQRFYLATPDIRWNLTGISWGDFGDLFKGVGSGGALDSNQLGEIARKLGDRNTEFGLNLGLGAQFGSYGIDIRAQGAGTTNPNASLRNWVQAGSDLAAIPVDAQLDGYGLATGELGFTGAHMVNAADGKLALGARAKIVRAYYSHYQANALDIALGGSTLGAEMGGKSTLEKTGFGLDLGGHYQPNAIKGLSTAMVVNNFLSPNVTFQGFGPGGGPSSIRAYPRTVDIGAAYEQGPLTLAADVVDMFNGGGRKELRMGGEFALGRLFAVRTGYGSRTGGTVGFGVAGFNLAFGRKLPVEASYALRF